MVPRRIFLIEPNLIKAAGHVIEFPMAVEKAYKNTGLNFILIANKKVQTNVRKKFKKIKGGITNTCFQNLKSEGEWFFKDIVRIEKLFGLNENDLIVVLTSYTNEINGVAKYLKRLNTSQNKNIPLFTLWFHQLFPPASVFSHTLKESFQNICLKNLKKAFTKLPKTDHVKIYTTPSNKLRAAFSKLSKRPISVLPLPYNYYPRVREKAKNTESSKENSKDKIKLGFLGDGRYEKGLLPLLLSIKLSDDTKNSYLIQDIYPRGYSPKEFSMYRKLKEELTKWPNIAFINRSFFPDVFSQLISSVDVLLFPYHPLSYDKRVSGVFIQSLLYKKPVIVSEHTWMATETLRYSVGEVFSYNISNSEKTINNLIKAKYRIKKNLDAYLKNVPKASTIYRRYYSPKTFLKVIINEVT